MPDMPTDSRRRGYRLGALVFRLDPLDALPRRPVLVQKTQAWPVYDGTRLVQHLGLLGWQVLACAAARRGWGPGRRRAGWRVSVRRCPGDRTGLQLTWQLRSGHRPAGGGRRSSVTASQGLFRHGSSVIVARWVPRADAKSPGTKWAISAGFQHDFRPPASWWCAELWQHVESAKASGSVAPCWSAGAFARSTSLRVSNRSDSDTSPSNAVISLNRLTANSIAGIQVADAEHQVCAIAPVTHVRPDHAGQTRGQHHDRGNRFAGDFGCGVPSRRASSRS